MHLINSHLFQDTPSGDDVLYTALIDKANTLGYTLPSAPTLSALNTLIKDMRRIGMIQRLDLFHVYASDLGTESQFRLMNICNAEMIGSQVGLINWSNQGSKGVFDGVAINYATKGFIDTNFYPNFGGHNYQLNNACIGGVIYENTNSNNLNNVNIIGAAFPDVITSTNNGIGLLAIDTTGHRINQHGYTINTSVDLSGVGLKLISRNSATEVNLMDIHNLFPRTANSSYIYDASIIVHGRVSKVISGATNYYSNLGISCAFAGASIPYDMAQNFRQVYNKYLRTIGLQQVA